MTSETQKRATYIDTQRKQKELRIELDNLDKENLSIIENNRTKFFELLGDSLLGKDFNYESMIHLSDGTIIRVKNLGEFIRELAYQDTIVDNRFFEKYGKITKEKIQIKEIWHGVKFVIFGIFPGALEDALHISKEREVIRAGKGATVDDIRR